MNAARSARCTANCNVIFILFEIDRFPDVLLVLRLSLRSNVMDPAPVTTPPKSTVTNVIDDPTVSLQRFDLLDLQPYTQEKVYATTASKDLHLFYVGRDDVQLGR